MKNHQEIITEDIQEIIRNVGLDQFEKLSGKNILITGANGLLASYIVDTIAYLNEHHFNKPCTAVCPIRSPLKEKDRLGHLLDKKDIVFIQHDVVRPLRIDRHIDFIVHAAGKSTPKYFVSDPIGTIDINTTALRWMLDLAVKDKTESFVYFSSAEVYGNLTDENIPTPETCPGSTVTTGPRSCYSESKRCGEALCLAYHRVYSVPVKILRPVTIYGPGLSIYDSRVMSEFMRSAIENKSITMLNEGSAIRNFCYITDATIMFWKIFLSKKNGEVFNIGHYENGITIRELASIILRLCTGNENNLSFQKSDLNYSESAPMKVYLDMSKVLNMFGYKAKVKIEDGLKRTIDWNISKYNLH